MSGVLVFVRIIFPIFMLSVSKITSATVIHTGRCDCAVFNTEKPTDFDIPFELQSPQRVICNRKGMATCLETCAALAVAANRKGTIQFCAALGDYNNLKTSVHCRICDSLDWTFTGISGPKVCCYEDTVIDCNAKLDK